MHNIIKMVIGNMIRGTKYITLLTVFLSALIFVTSCVSVTPSFYRPGAEYVTASWYGPKFNGRPTASGERFDMYAMTCAHKKMPFGTRLRVTNPDNNRSVVVKVNDRGPFIRGRDLDLSYGAAKKIGLVKKGVGKVMIERLGRDMRYVKRVPYLPTGSSGELTIQVGSFIEKDNAYRLKKGLELAYRNVYITTAFVKGEKYYRVRIGKFRGRNRASSLAEKLANEGYSLLITAKD